MSIQKAFTLIELLVVIAIIAILAAVALPIYTDYTVRTRVMEGFSTIEGTKPAMSKFFLRKSRFPANVSEAGFASLTNVGGNVSSITWHGCTQNYTDEYEVKYVDQKKMGPFKNKSVRFRAHYDSTSGEIKWYCAPISIAGGIDFLPDTCDSDTTGWPACTNVVSY